MNTINVESTCHYLFGKEASEIFNPKYSDEFVNQSLDALIRTNVAFLSKKQNDGFPFIDPIAFNHQCHLYSLFAGKIKKDYKQFSEQEKLAKTEDNRFLHLSFLLSNTFINDRKLLCQAIEKISKEEKILLPEKKLFGEFIKDSGGTLIRTSRVALNVFFKNRMQSLLKEGKENNPLSKELYELSCEDLSYVTERVEVPLYTLPKMAGVAYLINEKFPLVIKTKIVSEKGTGILFCKNDLNQNIQDDDPVIVFEALASEDFSLEKIRKIAGSCPSYFDRRPSSKDRHSEKEICSFCHSKEANLTSYQNRFETAKNSLQDTFYSLGADFIKEIQPDFEKFFHDKNKYPLLSEIFEKALLNLETNGLSMKKPLTFTIHHVYLDSARNALNTKSLRMNSSPQAFLKERGFI